MDRQSIERRDFPIVRRGYDPESVDRHLAAVATAFEALQTRAAAGGLDAGTQRLQARIDAVHREMETLLASLRTGAARVAERLATVEGELPAVVPRPAPAPAPGPAPAPAPGLAPAPAPAWHADGAADAADAADAAAVSGPAADTEGARLVALDLVLAGRPRHEVDAYLAEHFPGVDRNAVLDSTYDSL